MDTFKSYNYRLVSYIDLDPDCQQGKKANEHFLYSSPSAWTGWPRPTFPEIEKVELLPSASYEEEYPDVNPSIEFDFVLNTPTLKTVRSDTKHLFYRIIVKREIQNSISTLTEGFRSSFVEVGNLLLLPVIPEAGGKTKIKDEFLERETSLPQ